MDMTEKKESKWLGLPTVTDSLSERSKDSIIVKINLGGYEVERLRNSVERIMPIYGVIPLVSCFLVNDLVYFGFRMLVKDAYHYDFTTAFDKKVPFVPAWVSIYFICYVFWVVNYILVSRLDKQHFYRFVTADLVAKLICGFFFFVLPTTNVRPEVTGNGIWEVLMRWLYAVDEPTNLFPSIHCLTSWFCYIGIRGQKKIPVWYQRFSFLFAVLVCLSTQFTKQHYVVDLIGGVALAELSFAICASRRLRKPTERFFEKINGRIFGIKEG